MTALTDMATNMHLKVIRKIANQIKKLTQEATYTLSKTKPKRDLSIGSPVSDIDLASPEHRNMFLTFRPRKKNDFSTSLEDISIDSSIRSPIVFFRVW